VTDSLAHSKAIDTSKRPITIGIAGGSGSGKTTLAQAFVRRCGVDRCAVLAQDAFYIDQSARFDRDGGAVNFDDPVSLDFALLSQCIAQLQRGVPALVPVYDFATHKRLPTQVEVPQRPIIVVDGTLILNAQDVLRRLDLAVFVETPEEIRFARRMRRDTTQRGRTEDGVRQQFISQVKPMHDRFVEPSKRVAHLTMSGQQNLAQSVAQIVERIGL
jgi:uridine kinase